MAFQQGLSGLNTASKNLDVIGHNIANANTVGMKSSRTEFSELYASSVNASGGTATGIGVTVAAVTQQFTQGNITATGNEMDVAINGNGFYELTMPNGATVYSRASRNLRSTSYSSAKPKPPKVCTHMSAAAQLASDASSLAMLASSPALPPWS